MPDTEIVDHETASFELTATHTLTSRTPLVRTPGIPGLIPQTAATRYDCSCGELTDADTDTAQDHAEEVTP